MSEGWAITLTIAGIAGLIVLGSYGTYVGSASILEYRRVIELWDDHEDMRPFIAKLLEDGSLSNGDYDAVMTHAEKLHLSDYVAILSDNSASYLDRPEPVVVDDPDPFLVDK